MENIYNISRFADCPTINVSRNAKVPARVHGTYRVDGLHKSQIVYAVAADFAEAGFPSVKVIVGNIDANDAKAEIMVAVFL